MTRPGEPTPSGSKRAWTHRRRWNSPRPLRSLIAGDLDGRARALQRIMLPDVIGSDPALAVALELGQATCSWFGVR
jgi:hypothetical protein